MVEEKCKVCGKALSLADIFCPGCGFEHHILPEPVSEEVKRYEEKRIRVYKKAWEEHKQGIEKFKKNYEAEASKNKTLEESLKEEKAKIRAVEQEKERYRDQADKTTKELASVKKENQGLNDKVQRLTSQNQSLISEKDRANDSLFREREEHRITKNALNAEKDAHNRIKELLEGATEKPIEQNLGVVIGTVLFNFNGRTETKELYKGVCRVKAPSWANISGDLFEINGDKGVYCVWDLNGNMRDRRGRTVSPQGATTRNNDVFTIGGLTIKFSLPEIDYDSLF